MTIMFKKKLLPFAIPAMMFSFAVFTTSCDSDGDGDDDCLTTEDTYVGKYAGAHNLDFPTTIIDLICNIVPSESECLLGDPIPDTLVVTNPVDGDDAISVYSTTLDLTIVANITKCNELQIPSTTQGSVFLSGGAVEIKNAEIKGSALRNNDSGVISLDLRVGGNLDGIAFPIEAPTTGSFTKYE